MRVKELMTPDAQWISPDMPINEVARMMRDLKIGCLPVGEKDRLIGVITDRDIAVRAVAEAYHPATTPVREIMSPGVRYCFEEDEVTDVAHYMEALHLRRLPVLNHAKRLTGMLTLSDMAQRCPDLSGEVLEAVGQVRH